MPDLVTTLLSGLFVAVVTSIARRDHRGVDFRRAAIRSVVGRNLKTLAISAKLVLLSASIRNDCRESVGLPTG
jgi:hypothetical protein